MHFFGPYLTLQTQNTFCLWEAWYHNFWYQFMSIVWIWKFHINLILAWPYLTYWIKNHPHHFIRCNFWCMIMSLFLTISMDTIDIVPFLKILSLIIISLPHMGHTPGPIIVIIFMVLQLFYHAFCFIMGMYW